VRDESCLACIAPGQVFQESREEKAVSSAIHLGATIYDNFRLNRHMWRICRMRLRSW